MNKINRNTKICHWSQVQRFAEKTSGQTLLKRHRRRQGLKYFRNRTVVKIQNVQKICLKTLHTHTHTHCRLPPSYSRVAGTSKEKRAGREKTEKFQTHIYDMMLNCLSLCNSQSFFTAGWGRTKPAFCYSIVRLVLHPPIRFRAEVSGPLLHRRGAFATLGTPWKLGSVQDGL